VRVVDEKLLHLFEGSCVKLHGNYVCLGVGAELVVCEKGYIHEKVIKRLFVRRNEQAWVRNRLLEM